MQFLALAIWLLLITGALFEASRFYNRFVVMSVYLTTMATLTTGLLASFVIADSFAAGIIGAAAFIGAPFVGLVCGVVVLLAKIFTPPPTITPTIRIYDWVAVAALTMPAVYFLFRVLIHY